VEYGRPIDDHGEPIELEELAALVRGVQASGLWSRALRSENVMAEISFSLPNWTDTAHGDVGRDVRGRSADRPQLDLFGGAVASGAVEPGPEAPRAGDPPIVLEGVIDLAFRESGGWVIADYKTDVGTDPDFPVREAAYRRQVDLYAAAWSQLTGERVKERVLLYTTQGREERW
jgi:ATP-dependent exoDNAse (exonuclease V) beta subunit